MKKSKLIIVLVAILLLTGCVKFDFEMNVGPDKSFTLTIFDGMQNEYYAEENMSVDREDLESKGFKVEDHKTSTHTGYKISKNFDSIDKVSSPNCGQVELTQVLEVESEKLVLFKSEKKENISTYTADFTYDLSFAAPEGTETEQPTQGTEEIDYSEYTSTMEFNYSIALPTNATIISHNADKTSSDGHVLTWNMEYGLKKDIDFVFSIDESKKGESTPIVDNNNNTNDNDKDNDINNEPVTEKEKEVEKETPKDNGFSFKTVILILVVIALFLGTILIKIKTYTKDKTTTKVHESGFNHTAPPNNK